jgi:predicted DNA-binding antitoxin AbrB/MazE fold protein
MMKSIRGTYENGSIKLLDPIDLKNKSNVIITFLDDEFPFPKSGEPEPFAAEPEIDEAKGEPEEEYYEKLRKHKRYKARGNITIVLDDDEVTYPLIDYSAGGLSFLADKIYDTGFNITAALKYDASGEVLVMEFEITVRRVMEDEEERYKTGCQFNDDVDEELWHTIMGQ